jgi:FtsH-binding integral membrane protein
MQERQMPPSPLPNVPDAVRVQILATEHWSLLAARNITYSAVFSRTTIFVTVVSGAVVGLALVAQATDFGDEFYVFAVLVLPVVLFIGVATYIRLIDARLEDFWLVSGMNRLRHAYLDIAPELEPYFVTGHHDDQQGIYETYGPNSQIMRHFRLGDMSVLVGVIDAVLAGVVGGLLANAAGAGSELSFSIGAVLTVVVIVLLVYETRRRIERGRDSLQPRFPR